MEGKIMANKPYISVHNMLQVNSLEKAVNLLLKTYEGARITLVCDEYNDSDVLIHRRGEYEIVKDLSTFVSNPDNRIGQANVEGAPYYDTTSINYDGTKDSSNVDPAGDPSVVRADGTTPVAPYYVAPAVKYYFYKFQATRGGFIPEVGSTWKLISTSGVINGDQVTYVGEVCWKAPENPDFDAISCPESATYDPTDTTDYNGEHDFSNVATATYKADGVTPTAAPYWDGNDYTEFLEEAFDTTILKGLPVETEDDWQKSIIAFTDNSLSIPVVLRLVDNREAYVKDDAIYLKTGTTALPDNAKKGVDFSDVLVAGEFDVSYTIVEADLEKLIHAPKVDATEASIVFDEMSFHVDTLIFNSAWTNK